MRNKLLLLLALVFCLSAVMPWESGYATWKWMLVEMRPEFISNDLEIPTVSGIEAIPEDLKDKIPTTGKIILVDFRRPSYKKRLWVIQNEQVKLFCRVAHGKNSGEVFATQFSNDQGSYKSSIGYFLTGEAYLGEKGWAMKLHGQDRGINDLAYERGIVFHGGEYVSKAFLLRNGRIGRSHGCFVTEPQNNEKIIRWCQNGTRVWVVGHQPLRI